MSTTSSRRHSSVSAHHHQQICTYEPVLRSHRPPAIAEAARHRSFFLPLCAIYSHQHLQRSSHGSLHESVTAEKRSEPVTATTPEIRPPRRRQQPSQHLRSQSVRETLILERESALTRGNLSMDTEMVKTGQLWSTLVNWSKSAVNSGQNCKYG